MTAAMFAWPSGRRMLMAGLFKRCHSAGRVSRSDQGLVFLAGYTGGPRQVHPASIRPRRQPTGRPDPQPGSPLRTAWSPMPDYARPSNINSAHSRTREAIGLYQFLIGIDHSPPGISTDSARGPETTGNNRHDSGKPGTGKGGPAAPQHDQPLPQHLGKTAGQATGRPAR